MLKRLLFATISMGVITSAVLAQDTKPMPRITSHQQHQQERIAQGMKKGKLTPEEAIQLEKEEQQIHQNKKAAKADGTITKQERTTIRQEEHQTNRDIYHAKHNNKRKP